MNHHETFALAGHATTLGYKAVKTHGDILNGVHVDLGMEPNGDHSVGLSAYYKRDGENSVNRQVDQLVEYGSELWNMPLMMTVRTREDVDRAMQLLHDRCNKVRELIANAPDAKEDAA